MDDKVIMLLIPIVIIQCILVVINIVNLSKRPSTKYLNKTAWILLILICGYLSNIAYILIEGDKDNDSN